MDAAAVKRGRQAWRYAQEKGGQQLHLVEMWAGGEIALKALCGRSPSRTWRMTINVPLGHACKNCWRAMERIPLTHTAGKRGA